MCDIVHALVLERIEGDARAVASVAEEPGELTEQARDRLEALLAATEASRRAGVSDEEWELRVALGVAGGR